MTDHLLSRGVVRYHDLMPEEKNPDLPTQGQALPLAPVNSVQLPANPAIQPQAAAAPTVPETASVQTPQSVPAAPAPAVPTPSQPAVDGAPTPSPAALQAVLESSAGAGSQEQLTKASGGSHKFGVIGAVVTAVIVILLLVGGFIGHQYYTHAVFVELNTLQRNTTIDEIGYMSTYDAFSHEAGDAYVDFFVAVASKPMSEVTSAYSEVSKYHGLDMEKTNTYLSTLQLNKDLFMEMRKKTKFLLPEDKKRAERLIADAERYYDSEIEVVSLNKIATNAGKSLALVMKDQRVFAEFNATASQENLAKSFSLLAPIEKYSRGNHVFDAEEEVKEKFPYLYEFLDKSRKLMGDGYLVYKDIANADYESAKYKLDSVLRQEKEMNFDDDRMLQELSDASRSLQKAHGEAQLNRITSLYEEEEKKPLLPWLHFQKWETRAPTCYLVYAKAAFYKSAKDESPTATDVDAFLTETDLVEPVLTGKLRDEEVQAIRYSATDADLTFSCNAATSEREFKFVLDK